MYKKNNGKPIKSDDEKVNLDKLDEISTLECISAYNLRLATTAEIQERENKLKNEPPDSIPILLLIQSKLRYPSICDQEIYIPHEGSQYEEYLIVITKVHNSIKPSNQSINVWWDSKFVSDDVLKSFLHNVPDWAWTEPFILQCRPGYAGLKLSAIFSEPEFSGNYLNAIVEGGHLMTLSKEDLPHLSLPAGFKKDKLYPSHMPFVFNLWTHGNLEDIEFYKYATGFLPSVAIFREEDEVLTSNPVSFNLLYKFGMMGLLYTVESHRNLGLAAYAEVELAKIVLDRGLQATVFIGLRNDVSLNFHRKLGFKTLVQGGGWNYFLHKNQTVEDLLRKG